MVLGWMIDTVAALRAHGVQAQWLPQGRMVLTRCSTAVHPGSQPVEQTQVSTNKITQILTWGEGLLS